MNIYGFDDRDTYRYRPKFDTVDVVKYIPTRESTLTIQNLSLFRVVAHS